MNEGKRWSHRLVILQTFSGLIKIAAFRTKRITKYSEYFNYNHESLIIQKLKY